MRNHYIVFFVCLLCTDTILVITPEHKTLLCIISQLKKAYIIVLLSMLLVSMVDILQFLVILSAGKTILARRSRQVQIINPLWQRRKVAKVVITFVYGPFSAVKSSRVPELVISAIGTRKLIYKMHINIEKDEEKILKIQTLGGLHCLPWY